MTFAFAGYYFDSIQSKYGVPLPGLLVTVYPHGSITPATLYTDRTKGTPAANPVTLDANSNLAFYADPGQYDLTTPGGAVLTVSVVPDAADIGGGGGAVTSVNAQTGAVDIYAAPILAASAASLATGLGNKVDKVATVSRLYGTDGAGAQTTYATSGFAADGSVVHIAGIESITGAKTFQAILTAVASAIITAEDPLTIQFTRATFNGAGSNLWECRVQGQLTGYGNEGGELRSRAYNGLRVAFRTQSNVAGDNTSVHIFEATWSDNTPMFYVTAQGDAALVRDMAVGRDLAVTRNLTVAGNAVLADFWTQNWVSGGWYRVPDIGGSVAINPGAAGVANFIPLIPYRNCTLAGMLCEITTGDSTGVIRFGLASDLNGQPASWTNDFGTAVATGTGAFQPASTPSVALTAGTRYHLGVVPQGTTSGLAMRGTTTCARNIPQSLSATPTALNVVTNCYRSTGWTGALTGAITGLTVNSGPAFAVKLT